MKQLIRKTLLALIGGVMSTAAWADDIVVPTPVYSNDFSTTTGLTIVGNGQFEDDADARFGRIFHNDPGTTPAKQFRTNYLKLPTTILSASGANVSKKLTIGFWVNKKNAVNFYNSPIFTAYNAAPTGEGNKSNTWPMMAMETRGVLFSNNYGIFNSENIDNVNGTNTPSTAWLDDGNWHFYTCVITETTCIIYYDGNILNSFSVDNSDGHNLAHIFGNLNNLTYVCLGGNQAWDWSGDLDIDPAFAFDDFAVYDAALSAEQIAKIMSNKLHYTVNAVDAGSNVLKVLAEGNSLSNSVDVLYPRFVLDGTTLREAAATSSKYKKTYTLTSGNQVENIAYTNSAIPNVYYYTEAEDIYTGANQTSDLDAASNGKLGGRNTNSSSYKELVSLPAGTWQIHTSLYVGNSSSPTVNFKLGDEVKYTFTRGASSGWFTGTSDAIVLTEKTLLSVAVDGGSATGLDWIYITGTPTNNIIGAIDYTTGFMGAHKDYTISKGESIKLNFQNHGIGGTNTQWLNWLVRLSGTTGVNHTLRADNWVLGDDGGTVSTRSITQDGGVIDWPTFCEEMKDANVDMTITYTADGMFSIRVEAIGNTHTFVHNFAYNDAKNGDITIELGVEKAWLELLSADQLVTFGDIDWTTFVSTKNLDFSQAQAGLAAYVVTGNSGSAITKGEVTGIVPAGTPLLLSGTASTSFTVSLASSAGSAPAGNLLKAGDGSAVGYVAGKTRYVLSKDDYDNPVFKKLAEGGYSATVPSNKAYLEFDGNVSARELTFDFDSETTAISELTNTNLTNYTNEYFNLAGQRVANPTKGLYIVNGRKVIIK